MKALALFIFLFVIGILTIKGNSNAEIIIQNADSTQLCIVTGETIEDGGVKYKYLNKEVTVCCDGCIKAFKKEPASYLSGGLRCPVCDDDDGTKELSHTHEGVKYYFCGNGCKGKFEKDASKYLENYNK